MWEDEGWANPFSPAFPQQLIQPLHILKKSDQHKLSNSTEHTRSFHLVNWKKTHAFVKAFPHHPQRQDLITKRPGPHLASHICCSACCHPVCIWWQRQRGLCWKQTQRSQSPLPCLHLCKGNMKCMRLPTHFGLKGAALDGNSKCAGSFGALLFHMLASAVIRAIKQGYSSPKSSFYVLLDMERQSVRPKCL